MRICPSGATRSTLVASDRGRVQLGFAQWDYDMVRVVLVVSVSSEPNYTRKGTVESGYPSKNEYVQLRSTRL